VSFVFKEVDFMALHVFANFVTPFGTAANNRAENEGNITTLQKILWLGEIHSTVSAEAIRFALRRRLAEEEPENGTNRKFNDETRVNVWSDPQFTGWSNANGKIYIDDDLLGYMIAEAAKTEANEEEASKDKKGQAKGTATVRRAVLEVTRAISLTPWAGDVTFNAASPGATPSASKGADPNKNPVPYGTEVHATRYQYGIALTPERLRDKTRATKALHALCHLGPVAGNHGRFLFDFSPEAVVIRVTDDPAPRFLYCFETTDHGKTVSAPRLVQRVQQGDIRPDELFVAGVDLSGIPGIRQFPGVKAACDAATAEISQRLSLKS
jgi:CRISPR-associated protein Cst2